MPWTMRRAGIVAAGLVIACEVSPSPAPLAPRTLPTSHPAGASAPTSPPVAELTLPAPPPPWDIAAGLSYREVILGQADPRQPLPMIVAIHGLGDTPDNFRHLLEEFSEPARLILPRGLEPTEGDGWSWFPQRARDPDVEALARGITAAAQAIARGVKHLLASRPTVGRPIVTGFSQGGMLTMALAIHHPDIVGTAVAVGGWLPPPLLPATRDPQQRYPEIFALHGTIDQAVLYDPAATSIEALDQLGFSAHLTSYEGVGHSITPLIRRDLYDRLSDALKAPTARPSP